MENVAEQTEKVLVSERNSWLDTMADVKGECDRAHSSIERRLRRLESRARLISMSDEMKSFLVMAGLTLGVAILVPIAQGAIEKWRRQL